MKSVPILIDNVHKLLLQFSIKMITVKAGQKPTKEQIKRIRAAAKAPIEKRRN
jgi:uncharacterized protein YneF (UPF0154 family)